VALPSPVRECRKEANQCVRTRRELRSFILSLARLCPPPAQTPPPPRSPREVRRSNLARAQPQNERLAPVRPPVQPDDLLALSHPTSHDSLFPRPPPPPPPPPRPPPLPPPRPPPPPPPHPPPLPRPRPHPRPPLHLRPQQQ